MEITKIGVMGVGFVGGAVADSFEAKGVDVVRYDKYKDLDTIEQLEDTNVIFLCLPTPFVEEYGFDLSALRESCSKIRGYKGVVVLKSTIEPGVTEFLASKYGLRMVHNPEFLTARTALEDFNEQKHIVIGISSLIDQIGLGTLVEFYNKHFPDAVVSISESCDTESMKLFVNNFYAVKVQMFNEFYLLCQRTGADFEVVRTMMLSNGWINPMHTLVPGPDGSLSYGGACFPKDTNALKCFMDRMGTPNEVLSACITERNKIRKD